MGAALLILLLLGTAFAQAQPVVFVDWSWDSAQVHHRIAAFIVEHGYGYETDYIFADTMPGFLALDRGNADIGMEIWPDNMGGAYEESLEAGRVIDLGAIFPDSPQGWYVPTYMIEGDPERGIEPVAPDLRSVADLPKYWELVIDPEVRGKGRFYNCQAGWACHEINVAKLEAYGLDEYYVSFNPGSDAALVASLASAYERGLPWIGYYWEPTWVIGLYDMTMLEEPAYSETCWESDFGCAYPASKVRIGVHADFAERAPEVVDFLRNYETTLEQNNEFLAYMEASGGSTGDAAVYFLNEYEDVWTQWVPDEEAQNVKEALAATGR